MCSLDGHDPTAQEFSQRVPPECDFDRRRRNHAIVTADEYDRKDRFR